MDVTGWTDNAAIEAWLLDQSRRDDGALDLAAMALALAALDRPGRDPAPYAQHLAGLVRDARALPSSPPAPARKVAVLNTVLFERQGYAGDRENYDDLANADLMRVIDRRKGLPIALSILYLHTARGLGWPAEGVNFPGHFLVRVGEGDRALYVDPFERGAVRDLADLERLLKRVHGEDVALAPEHLTLASNREMLLRLQNNIKLRCLKQGDSAGALAAVERMALVTPGSAAIWFEAAALHSEIGQLQRARTCLEAVMRLDPGGRLGREAESLLAGVRTRLN